MPAISYAIDIPSNQLAVVVTPYQGAPATGAIILKINKQLYLIGANKECGFNTTTDAARFAQVRRLEPGEQIELIA